MTIPDPPFSRPVAVAALPPGGRSVEVEATPDECAALARYLDLPAVHALRAHVVLTPWNKNGVRLEGQLTAAVVQTCGVTLAPLEAVVAESFVRTFSPDAEEETLEDFDLETLDLEALLAEEDPPDPLIEGRIDLGDVLTEALALGLDPFPRAPGAAYGASEEPEAEDEAGKGAGQGADTPVHPFAVLQGFRKK